MQSVWCGDIGTSPILAERRGAPRSVSELAALTGRAEQNVLRTLNKLAAAGLVRLDKSAGRARRQGRPRRAQGAFRNRFVERGVSDLYLAALTR